MIHNFARRHYLTRPSVWRILAWLAGGLVLGFVGACILGFLYVVYLAMTISAPVR